MDSRTMRRFLDDNTSPEPNSGCWLWVGAALREARGQGGHATLTLNGKTKYIHRLNYERFKGPIEPGKVIDHLCRVRCCVNPQHLEAVTHQENVDRGESGRNTRSRTHCPQGHAYSEGNTRVYRGAGRRARYCRECERLRSRARYALLRKS